MTWRTRLSRRALLGGGSATLVGLTATGTATAESIVALQQLPATVQAVHTALYQATITTYSTTASAGDYADCAVVFTAPDTGRVLIHWSGAPRNIADGGSPVAYLSPQVRAGGTIGSGSVVLDADDRRSVRSNLTGSEGVRAGASHLLSGLTPNTTYNARILHRVTSQTGEFFHRTLIVAPAT